VLSSLRNIYRVPDLRNKVLFTVFMIVIYRFGAYLPVPGIDVSVLSELKSQAEQAITSAGGSVEVLPPPFGHGRPAAKGNALTNR